MSSIETSIGKLNKNNIFCINLTKRPERLKKYTAEMNKLGIEFTRFNAIEGNEYVTNKYSNSIITEAYKNYILSNKKFGYGGAGLSHTKLWIDILKSDSIDDIAMIYEDDAILESNFIEKLKLNVKDVPKDWDIILGGFLYQNKHWHECNEKNIYNVKNNIYRVKRFYGPTCYIINKKKIKNILKTVLPYNWHWDIDISRKLDLDTIKVYGIVPPLTTHPGKCYIDFCNFKKGNSLKEYHSDTETGIDYSTWDTDSL